MLVPVKMVAFKFIPISYTPIDVTVSGRLKVVRPVDSKTEEPIVSSVLFAAKVNVVRAVHDLKAALSIFVTVFGSSKVVKPEHPFTKEIGMVASVLPAAKMRMIRSVHV